ncbi:cytochrome P450 [Micromonospora sp. CA-259024]|uniref:cytochrome P450 n=1 Tax=Micromonospora sp. CA-259024 TaxID=3239965 RepID=UPI003D8C2B1B
MSQVPPDVDTAPDASTDLEAVQLFFGIMSDPMNDDPYTGYRKLQERAPVLRTPDGTLVLTRHADCDAALRHRDLGKTDDMRGYLLTPVAEEEFTKAMALLQKSMSFANPPEHTRVRQQVGAAFATRHVELLRVGIAAQVDQLLDELAATPGGDFMTTVARPLPVAIMADLLGLPESDRATVTPLFAQFAAMAEPIVDAGVFARATTAQQALAAYFTDLLDAKRRDPAEDLLSRLAVADLDSAEVVANVLLLFGAGIETTANLLGNGLHTLLTHPTEFDRLRADPALAPRAVEEMLRFDSPVHLDARTALRPLTLAGVEIAAGQNVTTVLGAANRDPERFPDPDRFDISRADNAHLSFAAGAHFCLGAHLTRLEAQVFLDRLLARTRAVTLDASPERRAGLGLRGFARLPVTLHP